MAISAQTLFHFTDYQYLKKIIETKAFFPRYCFETFMNREDYFVAFPMVCFCDIPLSQIYPHANKYNRNGIGLKKEWGIENGINPVFYLQQKSYPSKIINEAFMAATSKIQKVDEEITAVRTENPTFLGKFLDLTAYYKPREGRTWDKEKNDFQKTNDDPLKYKLTNFYDEREWRFVPQIVAESFPDRIPVNFKPKYFFYNGDIFLKDEFDKSNKLMEQYELSFLATDIKYIIVSKSSYVNLLANFILVLDKNIYSNEEKNILISKIISLTQIKEDF
jgi:hypothetical protein